MAHAARTATPPARRTVSELDAHLGFWLRFVSNHVSAGFARLVESNGVSVTEWVALRHLFRAGQSTPAELIDTLGMTKGAISKVVARLAEKGLAENTVLEADGRTRQVVLTAAGRALVPKLARLADQNDEAWFGHLAPALRTELAGHMKALVRHHQLRNLPVE
jgi:DNA-binding MarR family transcriptional regulator